MPMPTLTDVEARILAVLIEKQHTVPDTYPLSLNALVAGCNQKTSRDPVMQLAESEVQEALDRLRRASMVIETSGGRVMRYSQNAKPVLGVPTESVALLATLMLRGPQTAGELRTNVERLHRFSDISAIEGYLNELAERPSGAMVVQLPRQPGARENRWAHLLSGSVPTATTPMDEDDRRVLLSELRGGDRAGLEARIERLEYEVARLSDKVDRLLGEGDPQA